MATTTRQPRKTTTRPAKQTDDYGHLQPQAPELEAAVLGAMMIEKDAYPLVSEILKPESFYEHRHQLLYKAIQTLAIGQKPIDILTVAQQLRSTGELEEVGGPVAFAPNWRTRQAGAAAPGPCSGGDSQGGDFSQK